ncbi:MAG: DUF2339 domain-containing protein [Verrucomicrobia bacterium]|nr:DUF2339 domain-containing protein [Verrucomicrobiota bacterium]
MEGPILLLILLLLWLIIGPIIALVKANLARSEARETQAHSRKLATRVHQLERELVLMKHLSATAEPQPQAAQPATEVPDRPSLPDRPDLPDLPDLSALSELPAATAGLQQVVVPVPPPPIPQREPQAPPAVPARPAPPPAFPAPLPPEAAPAAPFSLEQFMGVKLFAWLGGIALFFGVIFFVKYAFEKELIPQAVRIALGYVTGTGLLVGGLMLHRKQTYQVLAQAFCATGVLILYGVTYAAHALYRFPAFGDGLTFALMALITVAAFLIAVRLNALVVAVLGMLGGFLTPVLVSTGRDNPLGLFGYLALLVIGLLAVSRHRRWGFLVTAAAVGTVLMQLAWCGEFFIKGHYAEGSKTLIPIGILVFFKALFLTAAWLEKRRQEPLLHAAGSALGLCAVSMVFAFAMLDFATVATRMPLLYGFILLENLAVLALVWLQPRLMAAQGINALLTFLHLALWTGGYLKPERLGLALAAYLVFGAFHAVAPVALERLRPAGPAVLPPKLWPWAAPLSLLLILLPIINLPATSLLVWPAVLLLDLLVMVLAVSTGAMLPVIASLLLTLVLAAAWLSQAPVQMNALTPFLFIIIGCSAVFTVAGRWLVGKPALATGAEDGKPSLDQQVAEALPMLSGTLPFALLMLAIVQLPIANPSPVFGVGLLLVLLLLGLALLKRQSALVPTALACILAVEFVWHGHRFNPDFPNIPLGWYLGFYALFLVFPFVFHQVCAARVWPWIASAVAGVGHFLLVHHLVGRAFPRMDDRMGLLPAAFAIPSLVALVAVVRMVSTQDEVRRNKLAWFGGVALLFITLIFPIQYDRQWLTVSWALEGALLLWLFRRVPHPGLQLTGLGLLVIAFVRLAINPAVFADYPRSGTAIFNWHLYVYGIVAAAQFLGAWWFTDPADRFRSLDPRINPRGVLLAFGGVLLFLLMNIEIADFFTPPGNLCVAFSFGMNFARDMTYSIAWGLFALGLLILGIWRHAGPARYAAIGLLVLTLLKLFLHDLAAIGSIFRIGALIGVAVIAFAASFLYQQFFNRSKLP